MATDQKRERMAEAAAARLAAGDNAAFSVTSGTMVLGALLAPKDGEHSPPAPPDQHEPGAPPPEATVHSTPPTTTPPADSAVPRSSSTAEHASDQLGSQSPAVTPEQVHGAANLPAAGLHESLDFSMEHWADALVRESGSTSTETKLPETIAASEPHSSATDLTSSLNNMLDGLETNLSHTLDAVLGTTAELSALWQQTTTQIDHTVGELIGTIENLAKSSSLLDLGHTLDNATSSIADALQLQTPDTDTHTHHDAQSSSAASSGGGASAITDLAGSLLGVTQHNEPLDRTFGTPPQQNTTTTDAHLPDAFDIGSITTADTGPITMTFMGQSYTDAFDTHDVTHHASHTLHGLV